MKTKSQHEFFAKFKIFFAIFAIFAMNFANFTPARAAADTTSLGFTDSSEPGDLLTRAVQVGEVLTIPIYSDRAFDNSENSPLNINTNVALNDGSETNPILNAAGSVKNECPAAPLANTITASKNGGLTLKSNPYYYSKTNSKNVLLCFEAQTAGNYILTFSQAGEADISIAINAMNSQKLTAEISYSPTENTNGEVVAKITTNLPAISSDESWISDETNMIFTKTFAKNATENLVFTDENDPTNFANAEIKIANILPLPSAEIDEISENPTEISGESSNIFGFLDADFSLKILDADGNILTTFSPFVNSDGTWKISLSADDFFANLPNGNYSAQISAQNADQIVNSAPQNFAKKSENPTENPPKITQISPNHGSLSGGNILTIFGENFVNIASVKIGENSCENLKIISETELICSAPKNEKSGAENLFVTNSAGDSNFAIYTYDEPILNLSVAENSVEIPLDFATKTGQISSRISAATDNPTGYKISIQAENLTRIREKSDPQNFANFSFAPTNSGNLDANSWGFQFAKNDFSPQNSGWKTPQNDENFAENSVVANTKIANSADENGEFLDDDYTIFYGANAQNLPAGIYETSVIFTAVANP